MTDATPVVKSGLAIGALGITYQAELLPGKTLAFETHVDRTMDRAELDEVLDTCIGAAKRQAAIEELPLVYQSLHANRLRLKEEEQKLARIETGMKARDALRQMERPHGTRRPQAPAPENGDEAQIAQFTQTIANLRSAIRAGEARVPYLKALIERREPPEQFPQPEEKDEIRIAEEGAAAAA